MSDVLGLACELVRRRSLTPDDAGCQALVARRLASAGFSIERLRHGRVDNLLALHGQGSPCLLLLGHTDVVPTGPERDWTTPPFEPVVRDGVLHGRGAADMKGSVAAFVVAAEGFVAGHPGHAGTLAILLTSDEEGDAVDGVRRVAAQRLRGGAPRIDWCLVGEPSSRHELGDVVRIGRRGSLNGTAVVHGIQGHVAYPERARNPIHAALPALAELATRVWDSEPFPDFPGTSFQIAGFQAGTGASNVIPDSARLQFNLRYSPRWDAQALIAEIEACFARHGAEVTIHWDRSGEPFHTVQGPLRAAVREAIGRYCGRVPEENTGGGTSDGRFIAPLGAEVVELGPVNASIHKVDECVRVDELDRLVALYSAIVERLLG